jgi:hypothetical protein
MHGVNGLDDRRWSDILQDTVQYTPFAPKAPTSSKNAAIDDDDDFDDPRTQAPLSGTILILSFLHCIQNGY